MDAISFVLGVRSAQLRSSQLKDLIYRAGIRDGTGGGHSDEDGEGEGDNEDDEGLPREEAAKKAWVQAVYRDRKGKEWIYRRT